MRLFQLENDPLVDFIPRWILEEVDVLVQVPERVCVECISRLDYAVPYADGLTKIGSNPGPRTIVLHPDYYIKGTATGEALRAHEYFHVWQRSQVANFDDLFTREAIRTEQAGLPPWENGFERPAYQFEQAVKQGLLAEGVPLSYGVYAV